jgi:hypothetical protein
VTLRRRSDLKPSIGTQWPRDVRDAIYARDQGCVGPRLGMPGACVGEVYPDHVRASGGIGMKSESTVANGISVCAQHHKLKTDNGRTWRPVFIEWIDAHADPHAAHVDPCGDPACPARGHR